MTRLTLRRGTDGADDVRQYSRSMMLMAEAEDLYTAMQKGSPTKYVPLGERGKTAETHAELWGEVIPKHVGCLEALLGDADAFTSTGRDDAPPAAFDATGGNRTYPTSGHLSR